MEENSPPLLSVVSPVYQAETLISELLRLLLLELQKITQNFEIILVEDGSTDESWKIIKEYCAQDRRIKGIRLSKNFGQHYAITAGLDHTQGNWVVVMDCDLQDRPAEIARLLSHAQEGFDIVFARRVNRKDHFHKKMISKAFYRLFSFLTNIHYDGSIANFGIYSRNVVDSINQMREPLRAFSPMVHWVGFKKSTVDVEHGERYSGKSSYNWSKLLNLGLDIALSYSDKPLKIVVKTGLFMSLAAFIVAIITVVAYFRGIISLTGFTSLIVSIWFLSGLIILILGILGLYISKIFEGIKNRPLYLISNLENVDYHPGD